MDRKHFVFWLVSEIVTFVACVVAVQKQDWFLFAFLFPFYIVCMRTSGKML